MNTQKPHYLWKGFYEAVYVGRFGSLNDLFISYFTEQGTVADVLGDGGIKQHRLLRHYANLGAEPVEVEVTKVKVLQGEGAGRRVIEPLDERDNSALATPTGSNESKGLARTEGKAETLKDLDIGTSRVGELNILHSHSTTHFILLEQGH